jgi:hypothetical protein
MADTAALAAGVWAVNHPDASERRRLMDGHRMRRIERERAGLITTDHSAADAWIVEQHHAGQAQGE